MTIQTAIRKLDTLSPAEIQHCIQRMDTELKLYERISKYYSPEMMRRIGVPYRRHLEAQRQQFKNALNK